MRDLYSPCDQFPLNFVMPCRRADNKGLASDTLLRLDSNVSPSSTVVPFIEMETFYAIAAVSQNYSKRMFNKRQENFVPLPTHTRGGWSHLFWGR